MFSRLLYFDCLFNFGAFKPIRPGVPGPRVGRGGGWGMHTVYNSKNIHNIEMKYFGVGENHKLINLA